MDIKVNLNSHRLRTEITNPHFLEDLSALVETSQKHNLVGRFCLYYSPDDDSFFSTNRVKYYSKTDLDSGRIDYDKSDEPHLKNERLVIPYPSNNFSRVNINGHLIAQVYTFPLGHENQTIHAFNLYDLAIARLGTNIEARRAKRAKVFRPFGLIAERLNTSHNGNILGINFYSENTPESYFSKIVRGERVPSFDEIAKANNLSLINPDQRKFTNDPPRTKSHLFYSASYNLESKQFNDCNKPILFKRLAKLDTASPISTNLFCSGLLSC